MTALKVRLTELALFQNTVKDSRSASSFMPI
jgi:hypothetical protein